MFVYMAFGLRFSSEIPLPTLFPASPGAADVTIIKGPVSKNGLELPQKSTPYRQLATNEFWLNLPGIGRFYTANGNRIVIDPEPEADDQSICTYLLGSCMGALLHQRHRLVIHGNAIRVGDQSVIFAGPSGHGKSTLAAAFCQRDHDILSDDLCAIDENGCVLPSFPYIKLWHDSLDKLQLNAGNIQQSRSQIQKFIYPIAEQFCRTPMPVRAVYLLGVHNQESIQFHAITGAQKVARLIENTYRVKHLRGLGVHAQHLRSCSQLANRVSVTQIVRPIGRFALDELVEMIRTDLGEVEVCA